MTEGKAMTPEFKKMCSEVADLVDVHGWSLAKAKAEFKRRSGFPLRARSKDEFTSALRASAK